MLRRIPYGDHDLILTLFTPDHGKISVFAKSARKDARRFSGTLEPLSVLKVVLKTRSGNLSLLSEAVLVDPLATIRTDLRKTAYASYWSEIAGIVPEEGAVQKPNGYPLLHQALTALDRDMMDKAVLHVLFQLKFTRLSGFFPELTHCQTCRTHLDDVSPRGLAVDILSGGLICGDCVSRTLGPYRLSKGAVKILLWLETADILKASRIRFTRDLLEECACFLEAFLPHHLGHAPRSLVFLKHIRNRKKEGCSYHVG
ncbi:DNA repair protein recO [Desulfococcus multivorans DSM 2059]|uniref:DNA repair protein RecO n=2 Tax=Desulfococcaceae TaxID=2931039 RepID=S7TJD7_DESML|nr:DNA repair protein recO [Desulfococcus multivorans DSM 2059]SJZ70264.1 DNA replication and repair protein RecO [Desulfococcus multivorans DSM 2059]